MVGKCAAAKMQSSWVLTEEMFLCLTLVPGGVWWSRWAAMEGREKRENENSRETRKKDKAEESKGEKKQRSSKAKRLGFTRP